MITERLALSVWVGGLCAVGYLAVPVLFASLEDRVLAGELAGTMFRLINGAGLVCGGWLLASALAIDGAKALRAWRSWLIVLMMAVAAVILLIIQPQMAALKAEAAATGAALSPSFGRLHGLSSGLYMMASVAGLVLVAAGRRGR